MLRSLALNAILGVAGAAILTVYLVGFVGEQLFEGLSKKEAK